MAGLVPAVHVFAEHRERNVDARDKRGPDGGELSQLLSGLGSAWQEGTQRFYTYVSETIEDVT